jgi:hypothetical protein
MYHWKRSLTGGLIASTTLFPAAVASAQSTYLVTIQAPASATPLPAGTLVFLFDGGSDARAATATISSLSYSPDYVLDGYTVFGTATAPTGTGAAGTISNDPSQFANGFSTDAAPFGSTLRFTVTFSGAALHPTAPYATTGSDFAMELFDTSGSALWTPDSQGRVLDLPINPNGTLGPTQYFGSTVATVVATPEPSSGLALGAALLLGMAIRARRRCAAQ